MPILGSDLINETKKVLFVVNSLRVDPRDTNGITRDGDFQVAGEPFLAPDGSEGMPDCRFPTQLWRIYVGYWLRLRRTAPVRRSTRRRQSFARRGRKNNTCGFEFG